MFVGGELLTGLGILTLVHGVDLCLVGILVMDRISRVFLVFSDWSFWRLISLFILK